jgi:hypothetical protein
MAETKSRDKYKQKDANMALNLMVFSSRLFWLRGLEQLVAVQ